MLREFAWKTFEKTGRVDMYVFFREIDGKNIESKQRVEMSRENAEVSKLM